MVQFLPNELSRLITDFLPTPRDDLKMVMMIPQLAQRCHCFFMGYEDYDEVFQFEFHDYIEENYEDVVKLLPKLKSFIDKWFNNPFDMEDEEYMEYDVKHVQALVRQIMWEDWV